MEVTLRSVRILAGGAAIAAAAMLAIVAPATAASTPHTTYNYSALGDSYSAGVGTDDYISSSGSCDRSPEGYPSLFDTSHTVSNFDFEACSGAKTGDVIANQLGGLSASTNLVTITIGGNDAGFTSVIESCIAEGDSGCKTAVTNAENYANTTLPGLLDTTYSDIRSHAPNAKVVVIGYPEFYEINGTCIVGLSDTSRGYINGGADTLDSVISAAAARHGFSFADVRGAFSSHEICSSSEWLNSVTWPVSDSYHPKAAGYSGGYLPALESVTG
jgi:lysophospholipase L1-like esterase